MAHGSGVISSPTGGAQRGDNGNNATGRRNGEGKRKRHAPRPGGCGATRAVQRGPRNSGNPTEAPHENDTTDRTVCTVRFFAPFCGVAQKFHTAHIGNSDGFFNFAYRYPNSESNQNDIPVL